MLGSGPIQLTRITFNPDDCIYYNFEKIKQKTTVEMRNNEKVDVIVKWKSTRPPIFNVQPNYHIVKAGTTKMFNVYTKGAEKSGTTPRDRFSAVISAIKPTTLTARTIWKTPAHRENLFIGKEHKKFIYVIWNDINIPRWWTILPNGQVEDPVLPTYGLAEEDDDPHEASVISSGLLTARSIGRIDMVVELGLPEKKGEEKGDDDDELH